VRLIKRVTSHSLQALAEAGLVSILVVGLIVLPALAAKGGNGGGGKASGTGTISLVVMDSTDGLAHFGQRVTFDISTTATDSPFVQVRCSQAGTLVYQDTQGFFPNALGDQWFRLGPTPLWQSGAADCTGDLVKYTRKGWQHLASTSFHVEP
jgi:hypothetical protein